MDKANKMDSKHLPLRFKAQKHRIQLNVTLTSVIELKNFLTSGKCKSGPANTRFPLFKELPLPYSAKTKQKASFESGEKGNFTQTLQVFLYLGILKLHRTVELENVDQNFEIFRMTKKA